MLSASVSEMLNQGISLLDSLSNEEYNQKSPEAYNSSIGGHYRHVIDHLSVLIKGLDNGMVDYDLRLRDAAVESDVDAAKKRTTELLRSWNSLSEKDMEISVDVISKVSYVSCESAKVRSTIGREAMYVVIHGVHHFALIGVMCQLLNIRLPEDFGVAPSTVDYEKDLIAAQ